MAAFTAIAVGLAAATMVGGQVAGVIQQSKANSAAKKQYRYERKLAERNAAKERIDMIRQARMARGALAQTAANAGAAGDSSIALGALGSIASQLGRNLSFLDTNQKLANFASFYANKANAAMRAAGTAQAISQIGATVFNAGGGMDAFGKKA